MHQYMLCVDQLQSESCVLVDDIFTMKQKCLLAGKNTSDILGCISKSIASRSRKMILHLCSALRLMEYCV